MRLLHVISIILLLSYTSASKIEFDRYTIDDGLSQNTVYKVFQDSRGYIWLGTQGGLDRFNGYEFKHYEHESNDSTSIVDGWIRAINEDDDGLLWLGTVGGNLGWFDPYDEIGGEIDLYRNHPQLDRPSYIYDILFHDDYIFLTTIGSGLCRYNRLDGSTLWYREDSTAEHYISDRVLTDVHSISDDEIIFGNRSIFVLNTKTNKHSKPYNDIVEEKLGIPFDSISVSAMTIGQEGNLYLGTWNDLGLINININDKTVSQYYPLPPSPENGKIPRTMVGEIAIDRSKNLWMPIFNVGVAKFDSDKQSFTICRPEPKNPYSLSDGQVESIIMDKSGAIWLGSARSLMKHDSEKKKFSLISNSQKSEVKSSFNEKWGSYPCHGYPPAMDKNAIFFAGAFVVGIILAYIGTFLFKGTFNYLFEIPHNKGISTADFWNKGVDWIFETFFVYIKAFNTWLIQEVLQPMRALYLRMPAVATIVLVVGAGYLIGGIRSAIVVCGLTLFIALSPWWDRALVTTYMATFGVIVSCLIGFTVGTLCFQSKSAAKFMLGVCDIFQTFPSFVYLIPVMMLFGITDTSVLIAVIVYATIPATRYTIEGLRSVPIGLHEAATMSGVNKFQRLTKIEFPLAFPHMMLGLNQTIVFALFMVIIGAFIGTEDLGQYILKALSDKNGAGIGLTLGICVAFIGLIFYNLIRTWVGKRKKHLGIA